MLTLLRHFCALRGGLALALAALAALLGAALLSLAPAQADGHLGNLNRFPNNLELVLELAGDPDVVVQPGEEFTVTAALRYSTPRFEEPFDPYQRWIIPAASVGPSNLRISGAGLVWEDAGRLRLTIAPQNLVGFESLDLGDLTTGRLRAFDERTIVVRGGIGSPTVTTLYLFDAWSKQFAGSITKPAAADGHFGFGSARLGDGAYSDSVAVWHETDSTAWMAVASPRDTVDGRQNVGRVYIYRLDWDDRGTVEATLETTLEPPASEINNATRVDVVYYGQSLTMSRDGSTLAVVAEDMNIMGAVYVYTRPDGPGQDWGDIRYEDGVKVTPVAIPSLGSSSADRPFTASSMGRTGAHTDCDEYCSRANSMLVTNIEKGTRYVALSADGRVLGVPASEKNFPFETPGGSFVAGSAYLRANKGEAYIFVAPKGGWNAAPRADMDEDGNPKTLIPALTDARAFDPETHYSPGPLRRVTEPDAVLVSTLWTQSGTLGRWFGESFALSPDGTTALADGNGGRVFVFQLPSVEAWQARKGAYTLPTATLTGVEQGSAYNSNMAISGDGRELAITTRRNGGDLYVFRRPADGIWKNADGGDDDVEQREGIDFILKDAHDGARILTSDTRLIYPSDGGCTSEVADGIETVTCPIPLANATVAVPQGAEGDVRIIGQVTVQYENVAASATTLQGELLVRVEDIVDVAEAQLGLATDRRGTTDTADDRPYPSLIERGEKTRLRLQILNENGKASGTGSVTSVTVTTTLGELTSLVENGACAAGRGKTICVLPASALTGDNSDELLLELAHPGAATGTATVWASVTGAEGESVLSNQLQINAAGPPTALAIAQPSAALLGYDPTETADQRNTATLAVSAGDADGNRASVPTTRYSAKLTDPDGKAVALTGGSAKAEVVWPLREGDAEDSALTLRDGDPQARVTILAAAAEPLAAGEYTLELTAGQAPNKLTATQTVVVAGGVAEVSLSADPAGEVQPETSITVTATVRDAGGAPVVDGTPVSFTEGASGVNAVLVLLSPARQLTRDGEASVTLRAVGRGSAYVRAESDGGVADLQSITVAAPPPPSLDNAIAALTTDAFTIWTGPRATTAAELWDQLEGVRQISKWDGQEWIRYGETAGQLNSGSIDFAISMGTVLWLSSQ